MLKNKPGNQKQLPNLINNRKKQSIDSIESKQDMVGSINKACIDRDRIKYEKNLEMKKLY